MLTMSCVHLCFFTVVRLAEHAEKLVLSCSQDDLVINVGDIDPSRASKQTFALSLVSELRNPSVLIRESSTFLSNLG